MAVAPLGWSHAFGTHGTTGRAGTELDKIACTITAGSNRIQGASSSRKVPRSPASDRPLATAQRPALPLNGELVMTDLAGTCPVGQSPS